MAKFTYGCNFAPPDHRDFKVSLTGNVPKHVEVDFRIERGKELFVRDQKTAGSCTGHGWRGVYKNELIKEGKPLFEPSPLAIYYKERKFQGTVAQDCGSDIRTGAKALATWGVPSEELWPYDLEKLYTDPDTKPGVKEFAAQHQAIKYLQVPQTEAAMKEVLLAGHGICIGFRVYASFESEKVLKTGYYKGPTKHDELQGGHCVWVCGVSDKHNVWIIQNSWGEGVGDKGYFYLEKHLLLDPNFSSDFWTLELLE